MPLPDQIDPRVQERLNELIRARGGIIIPQSADQFNPEGLDPRHAEKLQRFLAMREHMRSMGDRTFDEAAYMYPQGSDQKGPEELAASRRRIRAELGLDKQPTQQSQQSQPSKPSQPKQPSQPSQPSQEKMSAARVRGVKIAAAEFNIPLSNDEAHKIAARYPTKQASALRRAAMIGGGPLLIGGGYAAGRHRERQKNPLSRLQDQSKQHRGQIDETLKLLQQLQNR